MSPLHPQSTLTACLTAVLPMILVSMHLPFSPHPDSELDPACSLHPPVVLLVLHTWAATQGDDS